MRIAAYFLKELIDHDGRLKDSPIGQMAVLRMALDLREATERIAELESALALREAALAQRPRQAQQQRRIHVVEEMATGKKVDYRA